MMVHARQNGDKWRGLNHEALPPRIPTRGDREDCGFSLCLGDPLVILTAESQSEPENGGQMEHL